CISAALNYFVMKIKVTLGLHISAGGRLMFAVNMHEFMQCGDFLVAHIACRQSRSLTLQRFTHMIYIDDFTQRQCNDPDPFMCDMTHQTHSFEAANSLAYRPAA